MKKRTLGAFFVVLMASVLSGCYATGDKPASLSTIYAVTAVISFILLICGCRLVSKREKWFFLLFVSVLVVNIGYTVLSVSIDLEMALWANRIAYFGSVFLPFSMLMIILDVTNTRHPSWLHGALGLLSILVFLVAASPGILDVYYKDVSFTVVNGVSMLVKVYGPLHPLYMIYLLGYFAAMITVIVRSSVTGTIDTTAHAVVLAIAVLVNIGVWLIEQLTDMDFEFLSVSYIISELFLLGVHLMMKETQHLRELVNSKTDEPPTVNPARKVVSETVSEEVIARFTAGVETLTPTERLIYEAYLSGSTTKDVLNELNIKENTLKFHNKNIYGKLGVSSRKQLLEISRVLQVSDAK